MRRPWHRFYPAGVAPAAAYPDVPLWGLLERTAVRAPGRLALVDGDRRLLYGELWEACLGAAGWIRARGAGPGDRVLLRLPNSTAFVTAYYGALRAGCVVVAASPDAGAAEFEAQRADADPALVIEDAPGAAPPPEAVAGDLAVLQYTSGTTGRSKGAMMTRANLVANALQNARWFGWTRDEVNLGVLPLFHTWGMCVCLNSTFAAGGALVLVRRFDADETLALAARHETTVLYGSATMFHRLLERPPRALPRLRHVKAGAMLTQGDLKARWDAAYPGAPMQQGYGLTEASPESHNNPPARFKPGTVGVPLPDTDCRVVDPDAPDRVMAPGETGEVCLKGPQVCAGYWNRPDETAAAFRDGWLLTGDLGAMDDEGYLTIVDRKKDLLKFRGYTVTPGAVEDRLLSHPAVKEAVVVGRADPVDGDVPVAFVSVSGATDEELAAHCAAGLARYEVPRAFVRVDAIPKNAVGKPLRRMLRDRANRGSWWGSRDSNPDGPGAGGF